MLDSNNVSDTKDFNFTAFNNTEETKATELFNNSEPKLIKTL
jgi:hypothetical protein